SWHNVWDHKQSYTRLQSPAEEGKLSGQVGDLDALRRDTLGMAHRLKEKRERFERQCSQPGLKQLAASLEAELADLVSRASETVAEMRRVVVSRVRETLAPEIAHEIQLADEFLSHQLVEFLSAAQKALDDLLLAGAPVRAQPVGFGDALREQLAE